MPSTRPRGRPLAILSEELAEADFGDERLSRRLGQIVDAAAKAPAKSFPQMARSDAELEGTYRFLGNEAVTPERILAPHRRATRGRIESAGSAVVAHDTSSFSFGGEERDELGWVTNEAVGFFGHFALALTATAAHQPLGVIGMSVVSRKRNPPKKTHREYYRNPEKEYLRWGALVGAVEDELGKGRVVHVMDRAADSYELLSALVGRGARFVIRLAQERKLAPSWPTDPLTLKDALGKAADVLKREVPLSPRKDHGRPTAMQEKHPSRAGRIAKLRCRATAVNLQRPSGIRDDKLPESLSVNVVLVHEIDAPTGEAPIEWRLVTTEPIAMADQVAAVVDDYRGRWVIEEFFKALKTGCAIEKRQLESKHSVLNALAVLAPVAWRMLTVRSLARQSPDAPATAALTARQLRLLKANSVRVKLGDTPTIREALLAIAGIGGHLKRNGEPGWLTLGRGFDELLVMEAGWLARRCDQS